MYKFVHKYDIRYEDRHGFLETKWTIDATFKFTYEYYASFDDKKLHG